MTVSTEKHWPSFSLRSVLITTLIVGATLAVLVPSIRGVKRKDQRMSCSNHLKQIALAFHVYHDTYKAFPWAITYSDDGTPMHSWRVRLMPFLEQSPFFWVYDSNEPWNGPKNKLLGDEVPDVWHDKHGKAYTSIVDAVGLFRCPSAPSSQHRMITNYVMLIDDRPGQPNGPPNLPGSAPSNYEPESVIVIEIADSDIHWMEPRDVSLSELSMKINDRSKRSLSSYHGGACVAHADGSVTFLDDDATEEYVRELLTQ